VQWLFLARTRKPKFKACCDKCGAITPENYMPWVRKIFA